jgi:predicted dehydrogenase
LRIGIVGAGYIADVVARALAEVPEARFVAVASRGQASARALAARHEGVEVFERWQDLVASRDVDAVYCATPTAAREAVCLAAARAGKHLLAEKPFASLASLQAITTACREQDVAFMDATHFVWHPRHRQLRLELAQRIGRLQAVNSLFFFPSMDPSNIRLRPDQEPTGAIGDMAWYSLRALVEFTPADAVLADAGGTALRHSDTGALVRGAAALRLSNGCTCTFDVGYDIGTCVMDLHLLGERGVISQDDFVLDWAQSFPLPLPDHEADFALRSGLQHRDAVTRIATASARPQVQELLRQFVAMARSPGTGAGQACAMATERTQALLDGVLKRLTVIDAPR